MAPQFLCIVAGQRSGTTALQSALSSTGRFHDFGEIFQTAEDRRPGAFLDYARARNLQVADIATSEGALSHLGEYLASLREHAVHRTPLIDVKLNSWGAFRAFWAYFHQEPMLMSVLKQLNARFIFVARHDIVAQILSEDLARHTNKWHDLREGDVSEPLSVTPGVAAMRARLIVQSENLLYSFLAKSGKVFAVWYEDLYVDGVIKPSMTEWLNHEFGLELKGGLIPKIEKNKVNIKDVVVNYSEVEAAVSTTVKAIGRISFTSS